MQGLNPPSRQAFQDYSVNNPNVLEIIYAPLYDYQTYAQAGQSSLTFFQTPQGSGGKTYADTNMELAGALPNPMKFLMTGIEVDFFPANESGRQAVNAQADNLNDVYDVFKSGYLELTIGGKQYCRDAPLGNFPPSKRVSGISALTGTDSTADTVTITDYASFSGKEYRIVPVSIPSMQNFSVKMVWGSSVAVSVAARIGVRLNGYLYRASQ